MAFRKENLKYYKDYIIDLQDFSDLNKGWSFKIKGPSRKISKCYWCEKVFYETEKLAIKAYKKLIDENTSN